MRRTMLGDGDVELTTADLRERTENGVLNYANKFVDAPHATPKLTKDTSTTPNSIAALCLAAHRYGASSEIFFAIARSQRSPFVSRRFLS